METNTSQGANLQQMIQYAKANPTSNFANQLGQSIQSGKLNSQAEQEGIDLSFAGQPNYAKAQKKSSAGISNMDSLKPIYTKEGLSELGNQAVDLGKSVASSPIAVGKDITAGKRAGIEAKSEDFLRNSQYNTEKTIQDLINEGKASGHDTTRLESLLQKVKEHSVAPTEDTFAQNVPESQKSLGEGLADVAGLGADLLSTGTFGKATKAMTAGKLAKATSSVVDVGIKAGKEVAQAGKELVGEATKLTVQQTAKRDAKFALDTIRPELTKLEKESALASGRGQTKGILRKTTLTPTKQELEIAKTAQPFLKKGAPIVENINNLRQAVSSEAENLKSIISKVDHPYPYKELSAKLSKIEKPIAIKSDTVLSKQFDLAQKAAMDIAKKQKGTISGLLDARKEFDALVQKEFPNLYDRANSPMRNAITAMRNGINEFIASQLPKEAKYAESLQKQSRLFEAIDNMSAKSASEVGGNILTRTAKKYPTATKVIGGVAGYESLKKLGVPLP